MCRVPQCLWSFFFYFSCSSVQSQGTLFSKIREGCSPSRTRSAGRTWAPTTSPSWWRLPWLSPSSISPLVVEEEPCQVFLLPTWRKTTDLLRNGNLPSSLIIWISTFSLLRGGWGHGHPSTEELFPRGCRAETPHKETRQMVMAATVFYLTSPPQVREEPC